MHQLVTKKTLTNVSIWVILKYVRMVFKVICAMIVEQSWSNKEVETGDDFTSEIEEVIVEQRSLIAEEMLGYPYPAGQYNISARSVYMFWTRILTEHTEIHTFPILRELWRFGFFFMWCCVSLGYMLDCFRSAHFYRHVSSVIIWKPCVTVASNSYFKLMVTGTFATVDLNWSQIMKRWLCME